MDNIQAIGILEDLTKALEDNGIIVQAPEIKEALQMGIEALDEPRDAKTEVYCNLKNESERSASFVGGLYE